MFRNNMWWCIFILTLLDLSLNTKLTAQGESHDITIHDSFVEGITFEEWGAEAEEVGEGSTVTLQPRSLHFGRVSLGAPHSRSVTLANNANTTLHLASVAGTTPDFHASFFDAKTLPPNGNTTFNVVYLGRREGPVAAHLYIHTSLGIHKYPVSALGVASEYEIWPLVGLRVPMNATVEPELTLYNPTDTTIQVREMYSTAVWLQLRLPGGGDSAPRDLWQVPPRSARVLARLIVTPPTHRTQPVTAYVRVKADVPGGGLLLAVEARAVPPGEHANPMQVRLRARGALDPAHTVELFAANSDVAEVPLDGALSGMGCWQTAPPEPCAAPTEPRANGGAAGARLAMQRTKLAPHQNFVSVAHLTLDFGELWREARLAAGSEAREAWCAGCVRLGRALVPYSVRVLPGGLSFQPPQLDVVSAAEDALSERELRAHNDFAQPIRLLTLEVPDDVKQYFHVAVMTPLTLNVGETSPIARFRLREPVPSARISLEAMLTLHTDGARYRVPLRLYSGKLLFKWDWTNATEDALELGAVGASATRRVGVRLYNPAPVRLCLSALAAHLPGGAASFSRASPAPDCIEGGEWAQAWLTVVAPAREGLLRGRLVLNSSVAGGGATLSLRVLGGRVRLLPLTLPPAAPYWGVHSELLSDSSMTPQMRVTALTLAQPDPAIEFTWDSVEHGEVHEGRSRVARVYLWPEKRCEPLCYCGLSLNSEEGAAWVRRSAVADSATLRDDLALLAARLELFDRQRAELDSNFTVQMDTTEVLRTESSGMTSLMWPRLVPVGAGRAPLTAVQRAVTLRIALRSTTHTPLLLHPMLAGEPAPNALPARAGGDPEACPSGRCVWSPDSFKLASWRVLRGAAEPWSGAPPSARNDSATALPPLLLAPHTEVEIGVRFAPKDAGIFAAFLYLRNNLTIVEGVPLWGEAEQPSFSIAGRHAGSLAPLALEVQRCGGRAEWRRVAARNAGRVWVSLSRWRVAGSRCAARGFSLRPCAPLSLPPNASAPLHLAFAPDYSLSRVTATLRLHTDRGPAEFLLVATVPAKLLAECAASAPRPPWDSALRSAGAALAFLTLAVVLGAAALDAERLLRRARASRAQTAPRAPLDLRALATPAAPPPPPVRVPQRRRRAARRPPPALDPRAERRAFERWRAEVLRRDEDSSRSSDDDDPARDDTCDSRPPTPPQEALTPRGSPLAPDEVGSSASEASSPADDRDDEPYGGDVEPDPRDDSPADGSDATPVVEPAARPLARSSPADRVRTVRPRLDSADVARRTERLRGEPERRSAPARPVVRKERVNKRRSERAVRTPPPRSPAPAPAPVVESGESRGAVRWGESWSSVVAARGNSGATLAPIGSDVRRREPERAPDNSLFYFNGTAADTARADTDFAWHPPASPERQQYVPPVTRDYLEEARSMTRGAIFGVASSPWGAWDGWPAPVRPPPGFAPTTTPAARPFDPFRSLASIWAPAPSDWRAAPGAPPAPAVPPAEPDDRDDRL